MGALDTSGSAPFLFSSFVPHFFDLAKTTKTLQLPYNWIMQLQKSTVEQAMTTVH